MQTDLLSRPAGELARLVKAGEVSARELVDASFERIEALEVVELAKESLHPDLDWLGVVLNIADMRLIHAREALKSLKERFGEKVLDTVIRRSVRYAESSERGVSILDYAPDLGADYLALAAEVLGRLGGFEEARERLAVSAGSSAIASSS